MIAIIIRIFIVTILIKRIIKNIINISIIPPLSSRWWERGGSSENGCAFEMCPQGDLVMKVVLDAGWVDGLF